MIAKLTAWLGSFFTNWGIYFLNLFIDLFNVTLNSFVDFILTVLTTLFPAASCCGSLSVPLPPVGPVFTSTVNVLSWLFPVSAMINMVGCIMTLMTAFFALAPLARWLKLLD